MLGWIRARWRKIGAGLAVVSLAAAILGGIGYGVWYAFVGAPRQEERKRLAEWEERRAERKNLARWAGAVVEVYPDSVDPFDLDAIDPAFVPDSERYAWQPPGVVAILGSHSGRHWEPFQSFSTLSCVCWGHDGNRIYSGGGDGRVRVWEADSLRELTSLECPGENVLGVTASRDGEWLVACGSTTEPTNGWLQIWRVRPDGFEESATHGWAGWEGEITSAVFSKDSRRLAIGANGGWVQLWQLEGDDWTPGLVLTPPGSGESFQRADPVKALAFSPDGRLLAAADAGLFSGKVRIWDLKVEEDNLARWNGWLIGLLFAGGTLTVLVVLLFLAGRRGRGKAQPENASMEKQPYSKPKPRRSAAEKRHHSNPKLRGPAAGKTKPAEVDRAQFVRNAAVVVALLPFIASAVLRWYGPPTSTPTESPQQEAGLGALAFSPDGERLASGDAKGVIRLWRLELTKVGEMRVESEVLALSYSSDGKTLFAGRGTRGIFHATKSPTYALRACALNGGRLSAPGDLVGGKGEVNGLATSPDGTRLVAACTGAFRTLVNDITTSVYPRLRVWDVSGQRAEERTPDREGLFVKVQLGRTFTNSPLLFLEDSTDERLACWEVREGRLTARSTLASGRSRYFGRPIVSPDGRAILLFDRHRNRTRKKDEKVFPVRQPRKDPSSLVNPFHLSLFESSSGPDLKAELTESYAYESKGDMLDVLHAMAPDGQAVAWSLDHKDVAVWDLRGEKFREHCVLTREKRDAWMLALSSRFRWAAVASKTEVCVWDLAKTQVIRRLDAPSAVTWWLTFLDDGRTLAAVDAKEKIDLWDLSDPSPRPVYAGKALAELSPAQRDRLAAGFLEHRNAADLPDGLRAALLPWTHRLHARVTEDGVTVSREGRDGKETKLLEWSPPGDVFRVQFSGDGRHLIVSNANGTVEVVRLDPASADDRRFAAFAAVLEGKPDDVPTLLERARLRLRRGELHLALEDASCAVGKDAKCAEGWRLRGLVYARRGDHALAIQCFTALLKLRPQDAAALHRRGLSRAQRGDHAGARQDFAAALKLDPTIAQRTR